MEQIYLPTSDGIEDIDQYGPGGLHPVHLGDDLKRGRYRVYHKLGYGGSATVWLVHDRKANRYAAAKIFAARNSSSVQEAAIYRYIARQRNKDSTIALVDLFDRFTIHGPNGHHTCLILSLHGPSIRSLNAIKLAPPTIRQIAKGLVQTIKFLHDQDIAAGDLSTSNLLLDIVSLNGFSIADIYAAIGRPVSESVQLRKKDTSSMHAPTWVYESVDWNSVNLSLLRPCVILTDLNEAIHMGQSPYTQVTGIQPQFASPEYMLALQRVHNQATDIWALACCLFELRCGRVLMRSQFSQDFAIEVQQLLGPLPQQLRSSILFEKIPDLILESKNLATTECDLQGRMLTAFEWDEWHHMSQEERRENLQLLARDQGLDPQDPSFELEKKLVTGLPPPACMSVEEFNDFHDLVKKMMRFLPRDRLSIDGVQSHAWFNKQYDDMDDMDGWIENYDAHKHKYKGIFQVPTGFETDFVLPSPPTGWEEWCAQQEEVTPPPTQQKQLQDVMATDPITASSTERPVRALEIPESMSGLDDPDGVAESSNDNGCLRQSSIDFVSWLMGLPGKFVDMHRFCL